MKVVGFKVARVELFGGDGGGGSGCGGSRSEGVVVVIVVVEVIGFCDRSGFDGSGKSC